MILMELTDIFDVTVTSDKLSATIDRTDVSPDADFMIDEKNLIQFLENNKVTYGIKKDILNLILSGLDTPSYPVVIAEGKAAHNGIDGQINYCSEYSVDVVREDNWDFREVMTIPSVKEKEKIATLELSTEGIDGVGVNGVKIRAIPGNPHPMRAGKGVIFNDDDLSFYAAVEGQVSFSKKKIQVFNTYNVNESLSMKTGNLDFVGSVVIRGNVPTGYTVKADGDIKVYGLVEAATLIAGGSVFVSEGLCGLGTGIIQAEENVHLGYINQGKVFAGDTIFIENSVVHSECTAKNELICQQGSLVGGNLSAGKLIEAREIGNRLSTKTAVNLGLDKSTKDKKNQLLDEKKELKESLTKLKLLGEKLAESGNETNPKVRVMMLRQKNSQNKVAKNILKIDHELADLGDNLGDEKKAELIINNTLYSNVIVAFGKYERKINHSHKTIRLNLEDNEIVMHSTE